MFSYAIWGLWQSFMIVIWISTRKSTFITINQSNGLCFLGHALSFGITTPSFQHAPAHIAHQSRQLLRSHVMHIPAIMVSEIHSLINYLSSLYCTFTFNHQHCSLTWYIQWIFYHRKSNTYSHLYSCMEFSQSSFNKCTYVLIFTMAFFYLKFVCWEKYLLIKYYYYH